MEIPNLVLSAHSIMGVKIDIRRWSSEKKAKFIEKVTPYLSDRGKTVVGVEHHLYLTANYWYINSERMLRYGNLQRIFEKPSQGKEVVWHYPTANAEKVTPVLTVVSLNKDTIKGIKFDIRKWSKHKREVFLNTVSRYIVNEPRRPNEYLEANYWYINESCSMSHGDSDSIFKGNRFTQVEWDCLEVPEQPIDTAIQNLQEGVEQCDSPLVLETYSKEFVDNYILNEFGKKELKFFHHAVKYAN